LRGAEVFTAQLSTHLVKKGEAVLMVALFDGSAPLPFEGTLLNLNGQSSKKYYDFKAWRKLAKIIEQEKPDVVQANAGDTLKYAIFSKLFFGWKQPVIFRNASTISLYIKSSFVKRLYKFLFSRTSKIASVSKASAADFGKLYPECKSKITVIPIGIEEKTLLTTETSQNPFNYNGSSQFPILLHVGGFSFEKNHKGLIDIFKNVLQTLPAAHLHLIGDGPLKNETEKYVADCGLKDKVHFYGFQSDPLRYMKYADALLLPSIIEGLPGVILEAFYSKLPVIAYNVGGISEIVTDETGYLIEKGDEKAFANAVLDCISENQTKSEKIANAHQLVLQEYLNKHIATRFLNLYRQGMKKENVVIKTPVTDY